MLRSRRVISWLENILFRPGKGGEAQERAGDGIKSRLKVRGIPLYLFDPLRKCLVTRVDLLDNRIELLVYFIDVGTVPVRLRRSGGRSRR